MGAEQVILLLVVGLAAGFMSSMVGIGGGLVIVPALVYLVGMDQKLAQGTSLFIIALPVTAFGAYAYYKSGNVNWQSALLVAGTFAVGGYFGGILANKLDNAVIKKIFAVFMILIALKMLFLDKKKAPIPPTNPNKSAVQNQ